MLSELPKLRLAGVVVAWMAALLIVAWLVFAGREVAFERGRRATANLAAVVEQQVSRTFQAVYLTLGAVGDAHQLSPRHSKNDPEFQEMMSRRLQDLPFVRAVFIIGPDGRIIHDTDYPRTPAASLADRSYFRAYQADPAYAQAVWPPLRSRSDTGWFLPVTRGLSRNGDFAGVVVAAVQAAHFENQFRAVGLPAGYLVTLFHLDGTLVASYPSREEDIGKNFKRLPLFARLEESDEDSYWTTAGLVAGNRMVSYRVVQGAPFVVRVSRGQGDMLPEWRRTATAAGLAMLALTFFVGWIIVLQVRDSTRRAREHERRAQTEKLEALGQLSGGMAHDFANVLNVVGMCVEVLKTKAADQFIVAQALGSIERAVRNGKRVAERLLAFARRRPLTLTRVRLDSWLDAARPLFAQAVGERVALEVQSVQPLPEILCDVGELDVALINLLVNARDAMAGSGRVSVRADLCDEESGVPEGLVGKPGRFVCVTVRDEGPGMPEEVKGRAPEPFFSTKGEAGTGLGLSQVYVFMQQLGGELTIDSAPGRGTSIHLYFPVAPAAPVK